jgi:hypothetical protein
MRVPALEKYLKDFLAAWRQDPLVLCQLQSSVILRVPRVPPAALTSEHLESIVLAHEGNQTLALSELRGLFSRVADPSRMLEALLHWQHDIPFVITTVVRAQVLTYYGTRLDAGTQVCVCLMRTPSLTPIVTVLTFAPETPMFQVNSILTSLTGAEIFLSL